MLATTERGAPSVRRHLVVWIAVEPTLARLRGGDHGMAARARMFARVAVRRAVATARHAAGLAGAEMDPPRADRDALSAFELLRMFDRVDRAEVSANVSVHVAQLTR